VYDPAPFDGQVFADGRSQNQPAANVDPNVFSDLLPWFLAFCLIDSRTPKHLVSGGRNILSECVQSGDLIFFGNCPSTHIIFIDTVLRVSCARELPQVRGRLGLQAQPSRTLQSLGLGCTWAQFERSRSYRLNLVDAEPGGRHNRTGVDPHRIILGTSKVVDQPQRPDVLLRRFLGGHGFNFIPLAAAQDSESKGVCARPRLFTKRFENARTTLCDSVTELEARDTEALLSLILREADELVLDPLEPRQSLNRCCPTNR
jgi:hypothetical protein